MVVEMISRDLGYLKTFVASITSLAIADMCRIYMLLYQIRIQIYVETMTFAVLSNS